MVVFVKFYFETNTMTLRIGNGKKTVSTLFLLAGTLVCQLITFANSLDPDQDRQNVDVSPYLDPTKRCSDSVPVLKKLILKKSADDNKNMKNYPAFKEIINLNASQKHS